MHRLIATGRRRGLAAIVGGLLAAGCAVSEPVARPADFPFHGTDGPYRLHWRLDRESWRTRAIGVVESARMDTDRDLVVELRGLDKNGKIVSRGFARSDREQFTAQVITRGDEDRFEVVVASRPVERGGP